MLSPAEQRCWSWSSNSYFQQARETAVKWMQSLGHRVVGKPTLSLPLVFCEVCRDNDPGTTFRCLSQLRIFLEHHGACEQCAQVGCAWLWCSLSSLCPELLQQGWLQPKLLGSRHGWALNTLGLQRGHQQSTWEKWLPAMREVNRQIREGRRCLWRKERSSAFTEFSSSVR